MSEAIHALMFCVNVFPFETAVSTPVNPCIAVGVTVAKTPLLEETVNPVVTLHVAGSFVLKL